MYVQWQENADPFFPLSNTVNILINHSLAVVAVWVTPSSMSPLPIFLCARELRLMLPARASPLSPQSVMWWALQPFPHPNLMTGFIHLPKGVELPNISDNLFYVSEISLIHEQNIKSIDLRPQITVLQWPHPLHLHNHYQWTKTLKSSNWSKRLG